MINHTGIPLDFPSFLLQIDSFGPYRHLHRVLIEVITFDYEARSHQGLDKQSPILRAQLSHNGRIQHREVLGGLLHDYYRQAA